MEIGRKKILITTESICDLPAEIISALQIAVIPIYVCTEHGRFADGVEAGPEDVLQYLESAKHTIRSEEYRVEDCRLFFQEQKKRAESILHITSGRDATQSSQSAVEAAKGLKGVTVFDSGSISGGLGIIVMRAAKLAQENHSVEEIVADLKTFCRSVSASMVLRNVEYLDRSGRLPRYIPTLAEHFLMHPILEMRRGELSMRGMLVGEWEGILRKYIQRRLGSAWSIDNSILFIVHVGLTKEEIKLVEEEVKKYCVFEKVVVQQASAAISANCGPGTLGLFFARKSAERKAEQKGKSDGKLKQGIKSLVDILANEKYTIRQTTLNLILAVTLAGGSMSIVINFVMKAYLSALMSVLMLGIIFFALILSVKRQRSNAAGLIVCILANCIIFPIMYFMSGGMDSGMPVWFVLSFCFDWFCLEGWLAVGMFAFHSVILGLCLLYGERHPELITIIENPNYKRDDIMSGIILVVIVIGGIYKYQSWVYEKQQKKLKEHEEELLRSGQAKDIFFANMSHEIRTPINGILGMNTMMLRECGDNPVLQEYARNIRSASQTLLSLVNDVLDISKIEAGKMEIIPAEYDVFDLVNDCYQIAGSRSLDKGLDFELAMDPQIPSGLLGDELRIRQVVNNLISNAIKYTEKGYVRMNVGMGERSDAMIELIISVQDSGIGIREEDLETIFESYSRVDEKRNRGVEGTGLGLGLAKKLVDMMNGTLKVESIYGQGSTFTVMIPQRIRSRTPVGDFQRKYQLRMARADAQVEIPKAPTARILVVDDVPMNLLVARGLLKYTEMEIDTADSGAKALEYTGILTYDLILMDHLMPVMDGVECMHKIRKQSGGRNRNTPVVVLTANVRKGIRDDYVSAGFDDYLGKPMGEKELYDILRKYLPEDKLEK